MAKPLLVFVHGWSVTSTSTYGDLPARLHGVAARPRGAAVARREEVGADRSRSVMEHHLKRAVKG